MGSMDVVMCRSCGEFVDAVEADDGLVPQTEACPGCGGRQFTEVGDQSPSTSDE